jgi:hypothetical protein
MVFVSREEKNEGRMRMAGDENTGCVPKETTAGSKGARNSLPVCATGNPEADGKMFQHELLLGSTEQTGHPRWKNACGRERTLQQPY